MKIIYYFKNLKLPEEAKKFIQKRLEKFGKFFKKEETVVEVELEKNKEAKGKTGLYKIKIIFDIPKKGAIAIKESGKNVYQVIGNGLKKLKRILKS